MAYTDYDPYNPWGDGGGDWPGTAPPPKNTLVGPYNPGAPMDPTAPVKPPTGPQKPTSRFPTDQRPPQTDPDSEWNDDWWDGKSPYLGGWLVSTSKHPNPGGGPGGGGGGGNPYQSGEAPEMDFPGYESPGAFTPRNATFNFERFVANPYTASSWDDAMAEPGYEASQKNLKRQIEQGAANRGILRSGKTLTDEAFGLNNFQQENFRNFDDRRFRNWSGNESNRFNAWKGNLEGDEWKFLTEFNIDKDVYNAHATDVDRKNNYGFNVADARHRDALTRWQSMIDSLTRLGTSYPT